MFLILNLDFELKPDQPDLPFDGSRAGVGVFPPLGDVEVFVSARQ
jgi:hypothetical protein